MFFLLSIRQSLMGITIPEILLWELAAAAAPAVTGTLKRQKRASS
jgi:hypothetical protein